MQYSVTPRTQPPTTHQKKQGRHIKGALKLEDNWVIEFFYHNASNRNIDVVVRGEGWG